ncbi:transcriptional regulator BetI (plasmid) [Tsukamurella tyrosinosolvens]|uniref:DNA-binding transcriptional regulator, AcrR family n=2 Tax=Tsukamurella tyrosinosolvens TaxID=57704 RepID=A0A1H5A3B9_TSUTY|nr:DNA-binding transcriptional regulator, AcrR family [Tsukamurella tyrosinosolvens]VEH99421.1 transcriptional regulator BetI [Tsukamurella tyrosinosolvens]
MGRSTKGAEVSEAMNPAVRDAAARAASLPPTPTLRERKKMAAMVHIQRVALRMIDERGFDWVTVEKIAAEAEVSPSTVYRYFGTKEGLILTDAFDSRSLATMGHLLAQGVPPWEAVMTAVTDMSAETKGELDETAPVRARLWFEIPSVRAAAFLMIDEATEHLARSMVAGGRYDRSEARVIANAILWSLVAALRNWHEAGGGGDWQAHITGAIDTLRRLGVPPALDASAVDAAGD